MRGHLGRPAARDLAGAAKVDYATGAVSAGQGEGPAPTVALDTAALGGMYANSIRLVGTEAGVGRERGRQSGRLDGQSGSQRRATSRSRPAARCRRRAMCAWPLWPRCGGRRPRQGAGAVALTAAATRRSRAR
ncbi:hypothetical protein WJ968_08180 [Achromobacter xylosoxidans]